MNMERYRRLAWWQRDKVEHWPVPAWYTRLLRRKHRARVMHAMRAKRFDALPVAKREASYYW